MGRAEPLLEPEKKRRGRDGVSTPSQPSFQNWGRRRNLSGNKLLVERRIKPSYFLLIDPTKASLGTRLRYLRKNSGFTIDELSRKCGLAHNVIACLERDETRTIQPWVMGRILPFLAAKFKEVFPETQGDPYNFLFPPKTFGDWLKNLRLRRGMQQKALARALGVKRETIRRYEANLSKPGKSIQAKIKTTFALNGEMEKFLCEATE